MNRILVIIILSAIFNIFLGISQAFELMKVSSTQTRITRAGTAARADEGETYSAIEKSEVIASMITPPALVKGYIPFNRQVGILSFSLLSPKKTILYLEWDNVSTLYPRRGKKIKFKRSGEYRSIVFNATQPSSGYIYLYNSGNKATRKLLRKIPYKIEKQSSYSQSVRTSFRKQGNSGGTDKNNDIDMSLNYSINKRTNIGEARWSMGASVTSDKSMGMNFGYSW